MFKIVCGSPWTVDGRWVIIAPWINDLEMIIFDPGDLNRLPSLFVCLDELPHLEAPC